MQQENSISLIQIIQKPYETRLQSQHQLLIDLIRSVFPNCTNKQAKKLSFFLQIPAVDEISSSTQINQHQQQKNKEDSSNQISEYFYINTSQYSSPCIAITYKNLNKCRLIAEGIEQQVKNLQTCIYFENVSKKRLYGVIQHVDIFEFTYGQYAFEAISREFSNDDSIYLVKRGEFSYIFQDYQEKSVEILNIKFGHIFTRVNDNFDQQNPIRKENKLLRIKCKTSLGVLYKFSREFFISFLLKHCQPLLSQSLKAIDKLIEERIQMVQKQRKANDKFLTQRRIRSATSQIKLLIADKISSARKSAIFKDPPPILEMSQKCQDYRTLKQQQIPRNKLYSKVQLIKDSLNPQKNESDVLLWRKAKCLRLKQISKTGNPPLSKAETMLRFMKSTILFEKHRRKPSIL